MDDATTNSAAPAALPDGLLAAVKARLRVTWDDDATDANLTEMIWQGTSYLDRTAGETLDYSIPGAQWRTLLFEYVRYVRDNALDVFENNYQSLLLELQTDRQIARAADDDADSQTDISDTTDTSGNVGNADSPAGDSPADTPESGDDP